MQERLVKAKPHDWIIPKKIILGLLILGLVILILGVILVSIGSPSGLYAAGNALLGVGICFLSICLLLCLYAHLVWYVVDQETQTSECDISKTSVETETKVSDGSPAILDLEMVDGGYPTKSYDKSKLTPQPSPKRVRISPTTQMIGDGPSGKDRIVPTIITSSEEAPRSTMKATAVAVTTESQPTSQQQQQQQQQKLQQQQEQQLQQQQQQQQQLQPQQLQQQLLQQEQQQKELLEQQRQQQLLEQQQKQQQELQQQQQLQEQQKQLQLQEQQQQHLQQQLKQQQQQLQQQQVPQQYQHHHYQPTQVISTGRPSKQEPPGYADYEETQPMLQPQPPVSVNVSAIGTTNSQLPPTGAHSTRITTGAPNKPILVETYSVNGGRGGIPYASTPSPVSPVDANLAFQQQQQQQYQTLIQQHQKQQQQLQQQQQQQYLQQFQQQTPRTPIIVEPQQAQLDTSNVPKSPDQAPSISSSERSIASTIVSSGTQQASTEEVEDDDYDDADNMPMMGTYPRRHWLQDLENPPEPTPLQYPSAKRPMTFRNNSSSKNSIYDNVTLPYMDS